VFWSIRRIDRRIRVGVGHEAGDAVRALRAGQRAGLAGADPASTRALLAACSAFTSAAQPDPEPGLGWGGHGRGRPRSKLLGWRSRLVQFWRESKPAKARLSARASAAGRCQPRQSAAPSSVMVFGVGRTLPGRGPGSGCAHSMAIRVCGRAGKSSSEAVAPRLSPISRPHSPRGARTSEQKWFEASGLSRPSEPIGHRRPAGHRPPGGPYPVG